MAIFQAEPGKMCITPDKLSPPTNQHPAFYRQDGLPGTNQQCQSTKHNSIMKLAFQNLEHNSSCLYHVRVIAVKAGCWFVGDNLIELCTSYSLAPVVTTTSFIILNAL